MIYLMIISLLVSGVIGWVAYGIPGEDEDEVL